MAELEGGFLRRGSSINSGAGAAGSGGQARPTGIAEDVEEGHQGSEGHEGELEGEKDEVWEVSWDGPDDKSNPKVRLARPSAPASTSSLAEQVSSSTFLPFPSPAWP